MSPAARRFTAGAIALLILVLLCVAFPRVLAFVELAARELRYLWWLVLLAAIGVWLAFFFRRRP
ncbi:MAG: hypothetical protein JNG83_13250 [Opitutaceae bacterium]|nr:hypothetical protein [Opitutaceae bacterium]